MDLLERADLLDGLLGSLRRAGAGHGGVVFLGGEAGAGKSALLRRLAADAGDGARPLVGACDPLSTPRPLGPLADVAADLAGVAPLLAEGAPRDRLFAAVLAALTTDRAKPTLLIVEDAHWADEATLDLLRFLGRRAERLRALVVVTFRDDEVGPRHPLRRVLGDLATAAGVSRLVVPPLSARAVAVLAAGLAAGPAAGPAVGTGLDPVAVHRATGGNPFFVGEVLAAGGGIPTTVSDAVLARVARLSPAARAALDAVAVVGLPASPDLVARIAPHGPEAVEECLAYGMLHADGRAVRFRHELAREAILASLSPARRAVLHARVLRALTAAGPPASDPARLAHHAEEAGDRAAVLAYAPTAGHRAAALRAHREAAAQYARALRFADGLPPPERARLLEARAYECYLTAQIAPALAARRAALDLWLRVGDARKAGENRCHLVVLFWAANRIAEAEREAAAAVDSLAALPPGPELAMAYGALARLLATTLASDEAIAWGERAIALAEPFGPGETLIHALITVGATRLAAGEERGREQVERGMGLAATAGLDALVARGYSSLGAGYGEQRRFARAAEYLEAGIAFCTEHDLDHARWHTTAWLASARCFQGRWEEATALAASALRPADVSPITRLAALSVSGLVGVRRGEPAGPYLDEALALAVGSRSLARLGPVRAARAEAAWLVGDRERTAAEARAAFDLTPPRHHPWYLGELAYWRWRAGDLDRPPPNLAPPFALQIAGEWAAAATAWDALGCPYEAARARADGDDPSALREALAAFVRLGATPAAALVRRRLREVGVRRVPRGPRPSTRTNPAGLTGREVQILRLVAAGDGNRAIAARLFLSPRTVENHVGSILTKLGVADRAAAVREAARLGLTAPI